MSQYRTEASELPVSRTPPRHDFLGKSTKSADGVAPCQCAVNVPAASRAHWGDYGDKPDAGGAAGNDPARPLSRCHAAYVVERAQYWRSMSTSIISRNTGKLVWQSDHHRTIFALTDIVGTYQSENGAVHGLSLLRGAFVFRPSGMILRSILPASARFIRILQSPDTYDSILSEMVRGGTPDFEMRLPISDALVSQMASTLAQEMECRFFDDILVDALNTALAVRVIRHLVDPSKIAPALSNGLSRERLQRVREYIDAHLDDRLKLADLAGVACLSPCHFSRSFKQAVGVSPHRYVMEQRIAWAKALMRRTRQSLALIAQEVGLTDQSHLTSVFRRETGMTPGRYRTTVA